MRWLVVVGVLAGLLPKATPAFADEAPSLGHRASAWSDAATRRAAMAFADRYRRFLDDNRTVREVAREAIAQAGRAGFRALDAAPATLAPGAKVYTDVRGKLVAFAVLGQRPLADGVHVVVAHIDSVRLDLKQRPLYADGNLALLETHYYGGLKKYQWLSQPLALRGVVVTKAGKVVEVGIGDDPGEPVLVVADTAAHERHAVDRVEGEDVPGERLDAIVSSTPGATAAGTDAYAAEAARLLASEYGVALADLDRAELELVPAMASRDVGIDRALVGAYGQDDRACSYAALRALLDADARGRTAIVVLVDKEETGSDGDTGARSVALRRLIAELLARTGEPPTGLMVDRVLGASMVWSADTVGAVHPLYPEIYDAKNNPFLGAGVAWDADGVHAETRAYVASLLDRAGVPNQPGAWGKVGAVEGGTVLSLFTRYGMSGLDIGIPLLSMHAPFELVSKVDVYAAYRAYRAFLEDAGAAPRPIAGSGARPVSER